MEECLRKRIKNQELDGACIELVKGMRENRIPKKWKRWELKEVDQGPRSTWVDDMRRDVKRRGVVWVKYVRRSCGEVEIEGEATRPRNWIIVDILCMYYEKIFLACQ